LLRQSPRIRAVIQKNAWICLTFAETYSNGAANSSETAKLVISSAVRSCRGPDSSPARHSDSDWKVPTAGARRQSIRTGPTYERCSCRSRLGFAILPSSLTKRLSICVVSLFLRTRRFPEALAVNVQREECGRYSYSTGREAFEAATQPTMSRGASSRVEAA
jgi:hypothetical protein